MPGIFNPAVFNPAVFNTVEINAGPPRVLFALPAIESDFALPAATTFFVLEHEPMQTFYLAQPQRPSFTATAKDPADIEDYGLICTAWLRDGETVAAQNVTSDNAGIVISGAIIVDGVVRWRVTGGVAGENAMITVTVTSSTARRAERTIMIPVRDL